MDQVIAIRVVVDVRSYDSVGATDGGVITDGRMRKTYTVMSNVRNRMI